MPCLLFNDAWGGGSSHRDGDLRARSCSPVMNIGGGYN